MPAGSYEFYTYRFYMFAGGGSGYSVPIKQEFSLPFKLEPGQVVHVGKLKLTTEWGKNVFGMRMAAPGLLEVSDEKEAAKRLALAKCPPPANLKSYVSAPISVEAAKGNPFVRRGPGAR